MRKINVKVGGFSTHGNPIKRARLFNPPTHRNPNSVRILKSVQKYGRSLKTLMNQLYFY